MFTLPSSVVSRSILTPPASPVAGAYYLIPANATGAWAGLTNQVAWWDRNKWRSTKYRNGSQLWVEDEQTQLIFDGTNWLAPLGASIYDLCGSTLGKPTGGSYLLYLPVIRNFTLPAGMAGSVCKSRVAATAATTYVLQKNGVTFGSMNFAAGATGATFTAATATKFVSGDYLAIVAPATADSTQADIGFTFHGDL
jgi:hypothetical protein